MDHMESRDISGQVFEVTNMVDYREGSVVSREILKKDNGKVILFAFGQGEGLSEHTSPFDALVQILEGEAEIIIDGQPHPVKAGELLLMPANHPHALKATQRFKMMLIMLRG